MSEIKSTRQPRNWTIGIFMVILFLESATANFVHPVTPTVIQNLHLHDYMFGVAFAGMSSTMFLFSPFWGKISKIYSSKKVLFIGCVGYAIGQFIFVNATTEIGIFLARCFAGAFVGAVGVCSLTYTINMSSEERRGKNLAINAALTSVSGAFGFLVGGLLGEISVNTAFYVQIGSLVLSGVLFLTLLKDDTLQKQGAEGEKKAKLTPKEFLKEANPLAAFLTAKEFMNASILLLFVVVFLANVGTYAYDQCFNYYIKDQFGFTSAYNGLIKSVVGIVTLISNFTICMRLMKRKNVAVATAVVLLLCASAMLGVVLIPWMIPFIVVVLIFYAVNAIYIPLLQDCVSKCGNSENRNMIMAFYNSIRALGQIVGALVAGFIYGLMPKAPFLMALVMFLLAGVLLMSYARKYGEAK